MVDNPFDFSTSCGALAGHRDNHGLYLAPQQVEKLRESHGLDEATQWQPFATQ